MQRITWKHTQTADFRSEHGDGMRPLARTEHPEGMILRSGLPRAILAARRAYSRMYDVPVSRVSASPVYTDGQASIAHVDAYIRSHHFAPSPVTGTVVCSRCGAADGAQTDC